MSANDETIYLKIDRNVVVYEPSVTLGDIASVTSTNKAMVRQLKQKKIYRFKENQKNEKSSAIRREIFSILKIIELIHEEYPNAEIDNEGETDFIVEYVVNPYPNRWLQFAKTAVLCVISVLRNYSENFTIRLWERKPADLRNWKSVTASGLP